MLCLTSPHKKQVRFLPRYRAENHILRLVGVLVLVHHDLIKPRGQLLGLRSTDHPSGVSRTKAFSAQCSKSPKSAARRSCFNRSSVSPKRRVTSKSLATNGARRAMSSAHSSSLSWKQASQFFHRRLDLFAGWRSTYFQRVIPIAAQRLQLLIGKIPHAKASPFQSFVVRTSAMQANRPIRRTRIVIGLSMAPHPAASRTTSFCVKGDSVRHRVRRAERRLPQMVWDAGISSR